MQDYENPVRHMSGCMIEVFVSTLEMGCGRFTIWIQHIQLPTSVVCSCATLVMLQCSFWSMGPNP